MLTRQVIIHAVTLLGGIFLARALSPAQFGVFGIATFFVNTLSLFGDCGLAASLVQRKQALSERDLQVAFTLQLALLSAVSSAVWIGAPHFLRLYDTVDSAEVVWLVRALAIMLVLQSLRSISMLSMERQIHFNQIARIEVIEVLGYQLLAVGLAVSGFGVWSLVLATLFRTFVGAALAYHAFPWRVCFAWDRTIVYELARFGVPFQASKLANSLGTWVTPVMVGSLLGPAAVGLITWSSGLASKPISLMGTVQRVAFPHFARIQGDPERLASAFRKYLFPVLTLSGYFAVLVIGTAHRLVPLVYSDKWTAAIPLLKVLSVLMLLRAASWLLGTLLKSTGHVKYVVWTAAICTTSFAMTAALTTYSLGVYAIPLALGVESTLRLLLFAIQVDAKLRAGLIACFAQVLGPSLVSTLAIVLLDTVRLPWGVQLPATVLCGTSLYFLCIWRLMPEDVRMAIHATNRRSAKAFPAEHAH